VIERVEKLERTAESLAELPGQMTALAGRMGQVEARLGQVEGRVGSLELQIVQLRTETKEGFSAVRSDLLEVINSSARATQELFTQTWTQMRVLHEEVIERVKRLGETH
jgi:hypothetical protein